ILLFRSAPIRISTLFPYTTLFRSEKIVHGEVEQVVDSFMQNAVIKFRASGETEEYDCLVVLGPEIAYDIEVTDYSSVRAEIERRSEEHTSELQSRVDLVCRLLLEK